MEKVGVGASRRGITACLPLPRVVNQQREISHPARSKLYITKTMCDPETLRSEGEEVPESEPELVRYEYDCVKKK